MSLCRLANALFSRPPVSWLLPRPRIWDWRQPLEVLQDRLRSGLGFLEDLLICPERRVLDLRREIHAEKAARGEVLTSTVRRRCIMGADSVAELWSLNEMTIKRFLEMLPAASLEAVAVRLHTPGGLGAPLTRVHPIREYVVSRVSAVVRPQC